MEVNTLLLTPPQDKQPRKAQLKHSGRAAAGAAAQMLFLRVICQPGFKVLTVPIRYGPRSQAKASVRPAGAHQAPPHPLLLRVCCSKDLEVQEAGHDARPLQMDSRKSQVAFGPR